MIKHICDLCGKESGYSGKYYIPMMHSDGKFKPVQLDLCNDCCNRIDLFISNILFCQHVLICECNKPFDENLWKNINNNRYTARQWMKEYERMKSDGELDFIERYKRRG